jgi:flagellar protein FliS
VIRSGRAADAYRRVEVETRTPLELVTMLYDGALRFVSESRAAHERGDIAARGAAVSRALAIVGELQGTLNFEKGGAIADDLNRLYAYVQERLITITTKGDLTACDEVHKLLKPLRDSWAELATAERVKGRT